MIDKVGEGYARYALSVIKDFQRRWLAARGPQQRAAIRDEIMAWMARPAQSVMDAEIARRAEQAKRKR